MRKLGISFIVMLALALLALALVGFTNIDVAQVTTIEFQPGTTIDQAWQAMQGYDLVTLSSFYWGYPINGAYWVSSAAPFDPQHAQATYDEHWKTVLRMTHRVLLDTKQAAQANGNTPFFLASEGGRRHQAVWLQPAHLYF